MNKEQFIKAAVQSGYGSEEAAKEYIEAHDKSEYDTDDFIALYHHQKNTQSFMQNNTAMEILKWQQDRQL